MIAGHLSQRTWLHAVPARAKLLALAGLTIVVYAIDSPLALAAGTVAVLGIYAGMGRLAIQRLRLFAPLLPIFIAIAVLQVWSIGWSGAGASVLRLALMVLVADLVTATTPMLAMMDAIAPLLRPLRRIGVDSDRIGLAIALVLRFVPMLLEDWRRREEAWRARTGRRANVRLLAPWIADLLRLADRIAEALDARGFRRKQS